MNGRLAGGFVLALAMVAGVAWWSSTVEPEPEPERPRRARPRKPQPVPQGPIPEGDVDRALGVLASAAGTGWIACELGMAPSGPVVAEGLERMEIDGSVLRALVPTVDGSAAVAPVRDDGPYPDPVAVLKWTGAAPGTRGACEVAPARYAEVRLLLQDVSGAALGRRDVDPVGSCWGLDEAVWDGGGGLRVRAVRGVVCRPWIRVGGPEDPEGGRTWEDHVPSFVVELNSTLPLTLDASTRGTPVDRVALATPEVVAAALETPALPGGSRAVLERWADVDPRSIEAELADLLQDPGTDRDP